ncbi:MAG: carbohydrate binding domain-containing protein, partial [Anaerolineales bacterium]
MKKLKVFFNPVLVLSILLAAAGALVSPRAVLAQSGCSVIYDVSNGWMVEMCTTDPSVTNPMQVLVNGVSQGSAALVRIYHKTQSGSGVPQVAVIYASGYVRLKQNTDPTPSIPFGTSFILGPAYWPSSSTYYNNPQLTQLAIDTTWLPNAPLRMSAQGATHDFSVTYQMELPPPQDRQTRLHVTQTYTATAAVTIDPTRQSDRQGFKLVQASSMYINEGGSCNDGVTVFTDCHDSNAARYIGSDGALHQVPFSGVTPSSFIFATPVPLGNTWLDVLHTDDLSWHSATGASGNTPNARIALDELPAGHTITPQGWIDPSTNPNNDNVGLWLNDSAAASWTTGQSGSVGYWLLAQDNPPDPPRDIDLPTGLTFLDFEGSYDCFTGVSAGATANTTLIAGYSDKALQLNYDLGSAGGNWAQVICHFASPLDLSAYDHLRIDWRGDPAAANSLEVGLVDDTGNNFFDRIAYENVTEHAWWGQLIVPFSLFESAPPGTPFDPKHISKIFISVAKHDTNGDTGGAGSIAIDNLSAFNVASRTVPGNFETVDPANPVAAQAAADWLAAQQWSMGLLNSWEEHFENDHVCFASTYEQALDLMVFADRGMWSNADKIVDALEAVQT